MNQQPGKTVEQPTHWRGTAEQRQERVEHALHGFRERRRLRRADDTYFGSDDGRVEEESGPEQEMVHRRRSELLKEAEEAGMPVELFGLLYDIAQEEGLDPLVGFELVRSGLGVCPPEGGLTNTASVPSSDRFLPPWMFPATPTDKLLRERALRLSFRRLRSLLEEHGDLEAAFAVFSEEPDVGICGY